MYLFRQKETDALCLLLIDEEHDHVDTDLLPVDINPEILDGWCYVGIDGYWYIYGLLPEQTDRIKLDIHNTTSLKYSLAHKCFLLTSNAIPHSLLFEDKNSQHLKEIVFDIVIFLSPPLSITDRIRRTLPWPRSNKSSGPVPLTLKRTKFLR